MPKTPIVCPFCPLACDDLRIEGPSDLAELDCHLARDQFESAMAAPRPRIGLEHSDTLDDEELFRSLELPTIPMVEFHGATIEEAKSIEPLISQQALRIRLNDSECARALDRTFARDGAMAATLGDVRRFADRIWVIGDPASAAPRIDQLLSSDESRRFATPLLTLDMLSRLHALLGAPGDAMNESATQDDAASEVFSRFETGRYIAIVCGENAFEAGSETVSADLLTRLISRWNDQARPVRNEDGEVESETFSRAVLVRMVAEQSLRSVLRWRRNQVSASAYAEKDVTDVRIGNAPPSSDGKVAGRQVQLQIGGRDPGPDHAQVFIPASQPGVHVGGSVIRGDGSVTLPLTGWWNGSAGEDVLPTRIQVLERVLSRTS